jgi:HPt (histidine-containing phosphotransfer) domain-containing protein
MSPIAITLARDDSFESTALRDLVADIGVADAHHLLDTLLTELPKLRVALASACTAGDLPDLAHQAHVLKGMGLTFGAVMIAALARRLEAAGQDGDRDAAQELCGLLCAELDATVATLAGRPAWLREALS